MLSTQHLDRSLSCLQGRMFSRMLRVAHLQLFDERVHGHACGPHTGAKRDLAGLIPQGVHHCHLVGIHRRHPAVQHQIDALPACRCERASEASAREQS